MSAVHHAFFDANIYLNLYKLAPRDLKELKKLADLIDGGKLETYLTSQVADEVARLRAKVIADELRPARDGWPRIALPPMARQGELFEAWKRAQVDAKRAFQAVLDDVEGAARARRLPADRVASKLYGGGPVLDCTNLLEAARTRRALGRPPGKGDSLGDAVSWEGLLRWVPDGMDLTLVTSDRDFASPLEPTKVNEYLADEWTSRKRASLHLQPSLTNFLEHSFPELRLVPDVRKHLLIEDLLGSASFNETHRVLGQLNRYTEFTHDEAERLLAGGLENTQIFWLVDDPDVERLVVSLLDAHRSDLPPLLCAKWDMLRKSRRKIYHQVATDEEAREWLQGQGMSST